MHITPGTVEGDITVPGSKSVTHRAFILAAQSEAPCTVTAPLRSADTDATLSVLHALGHQVRPEQDAVAFVPAPAMPPREVLDCRNSGTTLRLMTAAAARHPFPVAFTGDESLRARPNGPLLDALARGGAKIEGGPTAPYTVQGPMAPGTYRLPASTSSQFASGLLLTLPLMSGPSRLVMEEPVASRPYIDLTLAVAAAFGIHIDATTSMFDIPPGQVPRAVAYRVEGDWSTAAFPLVAAAITGGRVTLQGLDPSSAQGDKAILEHLATFGCTVQAQGTGVDTAIRVEGGALETPGTIDVAATPDMFPALCVLAAYAQGKTMFTGGAALRAKECDRITAMAQGLTAMGVDVEELPDGLVVTGGSPRGATIHAFDDHRIHMAFSVAGLAAKGNTVVDGDGCEAVSYPRFHADLRRLRGAA